MVLPPSAPRQEEDTIAKEAPASSLSSLSHICVSVSKVGGIFVHKPNQDALGEKSPTLREAAMPEPLPPDQDAAAQSLAEELQDAIQGELQEMVQLLQQADPASLFGPTEFKVRDLALKIAAKAYQQRLAQKKTATLPPA
jgi:hypothetical protein